MSLMDFTDVCSVILYALLLCLVSGELVPHLWYETRSESVSERPISSGSEAERYIPLFSWL